MFVHVTCTHIQGCCWCVVTGMYKPCMLTVQVWTESIAMSVSMIVGLALLVMVPINLLLVQGNDSHRGNKIAQKLIYEQQLSNQHRYMHQDLHGVQTLRISTKLDGVHNFADHPHLIVRSTHNTSGSDEYSESSDNCTNPRNPPQKYKNSCDFVHNECASKAELIDYMAFVVCDLPSVQVSTSWPSGSYYFDVLV